MLEFDLHLYSAACSSFNVTRRMACIIVQPILLRGEGSRHNRRSEFSEHYQSTA